MLDYAYLDEVKVTEDVVERLFLFAFMLDCGDLQQLCIDYMFSR